MYKGYVSRPVVEQPLVMPQVRYMCMLLPFVMLHVRHAHLGLHIGVSLKGRTTRIWSFCCSFAYANTIGHAYFELLFGIIIFLYLLTIIK